jgi:FkbM family methyltransferase
MESSPPIPVQMPAWKNGLAAVLRRLPFVARSGAGQAYLRWQRARRRSARRRAEARGDTTLSRPALHDIDAKLDRYIGGVQAGFFVEAGANDGFEQSNTYHLERFRGWTGLLVEPTPHLHREAVLERPGSRVVRAALAGPEQHGCELELEYGGLMTVVADARGSTEDATRYVSEAFALGLEAPGSFTARAATLSSLLDEMDAPEIDLMSLDVEGFEAEALKGLDLDRHAPRFLLVEQHDDARRTAVETILGDRYRRCERLSPHDVLYARDDQRAANGERPPAVTSASLRGE